MLLKLVALDHKGCELGIEIAVLVLQRLLHLLCGLFAVTALVLVGLLPFLGLEIEFGVLFPEGFKNFRELVAGLVVHSV